jgi:hypothetical protein
MLEMGFNEFNVWLLNGLVCKYGIINAVTSIINHSVN